MTNRATVAPQSTLDWVLRGRVPGLDGLRAVSIILVLGFHANATDGFPQSRLSGGVLWRGSIGVSIFFCISGFLITLLLLREADRNGRVSLKAFYIRRFFRIVPAYWTFLAFVLVLMVTSAIHPSFSRLFAAFTYTTNLHGPGIFGVWETDHTWSLSTEEHFYFVWPAAFVLLGTAGAIGPAIVLLGEPFLRVGLHVLWGPTANLSWFSPVQFDAIAAGCLLAYFVRSETAQRFAGWLETSILTPFIPGLMLVLLLAVRGRHRIEGSHFEDFAPSIETILIVVLIFSSIAAPKRWFCRLLEWRPLVFVGLLSYSLYLWQQPFLKDTSPAAWWCRWPVNFLLSIVCALGSYYLVERPFLRLKDRLAERGNARAGAAIELAAADAH